jgi:hypothetical protein
VERALSYVEKLVEFMPGLAGPRQPIKNIRRQLEKAPGTR